MNIKYIFFGILLFAAFSCKNQDTAEKQISTMTEIEEVSAKGIRKGAIEVFVENEKIVCNNVNSEMGVIYYDHTAVPDNNGVNYQIGGFSDDGAVVGMTLTTNKVGVYKFSRIDGEMYSVDINTRSSEGNKKAMVVSSDVGTITITKSDKDFISGHFSGRGLKMDDPESLKLVPVNIKGKFTDIPLFKLAE